MAGNIALAGDLLSENVRANGVLADVARPKRRIHERLAGFADLTTILRDIFSAHDRVVTRLCLARYPYRPIRGFRGCRQAGAGPGLCGLAFAGGMAAEISTIQDQFALLKQIGYLAEDVCAA